MGTTIYKTSVAQQNGVTPNTWVDVTFNTRQLGSLGIKGMDITGFYNKWMNLVTNAAENTATGDYPFTGQVRFTKVRRDRIAKLRAILSRSDTGAFAVSYIGGGIARITVPNLAPYANVGNPTNTIDPWYNTNTITVGGTTDPVYSITGNIVAFDPNGQWIEYDGIVGTPSPDSATSASIEVGIMFDSKSGNLLVFDSDNYDFINLPRELPDSFKDDLVKLQFWHDETNSINLVWGKFDCFMLGRRHK